MCQRYQLPKRFSPKKMFVITIDIENCLNFSNEKTSTARKSKHGAILSAHEATSSQFLCHLVPLQRATVSSFAIPMKATWSKSFSVLQWFGKERCYCTLTTTTTKYCQVWWGSAGWQRREAKAIMGWLSSWVPAGAWTLRPTQANQILTHHHCFVLIMIFVIITVVIIFIFVIVTIKYQMVLTDDLRIFFQVLENIVTICLTTITKTFRCYCLAIKSGWQLPRLWPVWPLRRTLTRLIINVEVMRFLI